MQIITFFFFYIYFALKCTFTCERIILQKHFKYFLNNFFTYNLILLYK